ncbi:hypothetical protein Ddep01_00289 [Deinococcus depolymerans]
MIRRDRDESAHTQPGRLLTVTLALLLLMLLGGTLARLL